MVRKTAKASKKQAGKLAPLYTFFLNPYADVRYSTCPQCDNPTKLRKHPILVHLEPNLPILLNMTGPYCPRCDLLILHQDRVEQLLIAACEKNGHPDLIGNEYFVIGTVERSYFRATMQQKPPAEPLYDCLHGFKRYVSFERARWVREPEETPDEQQH